MIKGKGAFEKPIAEGKVRIQVVITAMYCSVENFAPDFLSFQDDNPKLIIQSGSERVAKLLKSQELTFDIPENAVPGEEVSMILNGDNTVWFDVDNDFAGDIWSATCDFRISTDYPRYLSYDIRRINYELKWLQHDQKNGSIHSISSTKKVYKPAPPKVEATYDLDEVTRVSDMLGRAIKKIDLRTGSAYVRFNDDNGKLDPLITAMGEKLGYQVARIDRETKQKMEIKGDRVSHIISLIRGY